MELKINLIIKKKKIEKIWYIMSHDFTISFIQTNIFFEFR